LAHEYPDFMTIDARPVWSVNWNDSLSTGISEIDAEHQDFLRQVNELNEALVLNKSAKDVQIRMNMIFGDAVRHFEHEETVFKELAYPGGDEHAEKHLEITQYLKEVMQSFQSGRQERGWLEAGLEIRLILLQHLLNDDMKYRDYFAKVRPKSS